MSSLDSARNHAALAGTIDTLICMTLTKVMYSVQGHTSAPATTSAPPMTSLGVSRPPRKIKAGTIANTALSMSMMTTCRASVVLPRRYYTANAAARIIHVAPVARNQVHMNMEHRLTGNLADIDAEIVSFGSEIPIQQLFRLIG